MTTGKRVKEILINGEFVPAKTRVHMSPGQSLKVIRELQGLSQNQLAKALRVHPAIIVFPGWNVNEAS